MLYMLGPIAIDVYPYNAHEVSHDAKTDFAKKSVLGRRQPNEHVGEGDEAIKLSGRLYPEKLPGGMEMHELLHSLRRTGEPQFLLRGDGAPLGWYLIESASEKSTFLNAHGVGQLIEIEINLTRDDPPDAADFMGVFSELFG